MSLMFVLGVMNILWIAALSGLMLVEKIAPGGHRVSRAFGLIFIVWGAWMVGRALV
jgi:predicted metal-binding membrane protein